jgi:hypothetical protein
MRYGEMRDRRMLLSPGFNLEREHTSAAGGTTPMEEDMLDFGCDMRGNSRLSCQIRLIEILETRNPTASR